MIRALITQLAVISAVCTCVLIICPESAVKKYVKLACSLCVLSLIISFLPFKTDIYQAEGVSVSVTDMTDEAKRMIKEQTASRICGAVYELAYGKYGIEKDGISVSVSYTEREDGVTELTKAEIELNGIKYAVFTVPLKNSVSDLIGIPCEVVVNE
ncbi:MAG: hypothetical protein IJT49_08035 [Clostridia bacterium]|nr:hypothetical protein [Clostridia bacterium]